MNLPSWSLGHDLADGVVGLDKPGHAQRPGASPGLCHVSITGCALRAGPHKTCWRLMRRVNSAMSVYPERLEGVWVMNNDLRHELLS